MFPARSALKMAVATAAALTLVSVVVGCGSGPADYDTAANYTAESLAQELILRYRALNPDGKTSKRGSGNRLSDETIGARNKVDKKALTRTTKKSGTTTIDDVLEDIDNKITLVTGTSRAETTKSMIEVISSDKSLAENEKKNLAELVGRLEK
jgi:hypothetical protein